MNAGVINVEVSRTIRKPVDLVRRQYMDIEHHARVCVHPGITFKVHSQTEDESRYRLEQRVFGLRMVDEYVSRRMPDGTVVGEVLSGSNAGMRTVIFFESQGQEATATTLKLFMPVRGLMKLFKPIYKIGAHWSLAKALEEDRRDLEECRYPSRAPG